MRRLIYALAFLYAGLAWGDVVCVGTSASCQSSSTVIVNGGGTLTTNTIPKAASGATVANSTITDDGTTVTINTATTLHSAVTVGSLTSNFMDVIGTMPSAPASNSYGSVFQCNGSGSSGTAQQGCMLNYFNAGYTGAGSTFANYSLNSNAGTSTAPYGGASDTTAIGDIGVFGQAISSSAGTRIGVYAAGFNTGTGPGYGVFGNGNTNTGVSVGVVGVSTFGGTRIGGYFGFNTTTPTYTSAALMADNVAVAAPILDLRDNGTDVATVQDGGSMWRSQATKTLTESSATTFVRVAVASGARTGGMVYYCINAADAADHQERCGNVSFAVVNKAGTETCALGTAADAVAVSTGTLTVSFTADTATPTNGCDLQANAVSSLTQTTLNMSYYVNLSGVAASAVTPQ